jgi:hypothetical protein
VTPCAAATNGYKFFASGGFSSGAARHIRGHHSSAVQPGNSKSLLHASRRADLRESVEIDELDGEAVNVAHASMLGLGFVISFFIAAAGLLATFLIGIAASFLWLLR